MFDTSDNKTCVKHLQCMNQVQQKCYKFNSLSKRYEYLICCIFELWLGHDSCIKQHTAYVFTRINIEYIKLTRQICDPYIPRCRKYQSIRRYYHLMHLNFFHLAA